MKKVEITTTLAFVNGYEVKRGNSCVELEQLPNGQTASVYYLHGHRIAYLNRRTGVLAIGDAGWQTVTTKSRINAILGTLFDTGAGIRQRDWQWYLTGPNAVVYHWDGGASFHIGSGKPACELRKAA